MSPKMFRREETIFSFASLKMKTKKHSGKKPNIRFKIEGNAIGVGVYDDAISIVLLRWNEIPCRKDKKKQKRKEEQSADKNVCSNRKTVIKQPVKRVNRNASGHETPVKISRKEIGNQIRRKDVVHLQKHGCEQRKTVIKQPVKRVNRNASGHETPVKISRKAIGNQIRIKDVVHLQKHGCEQPQLEYFNSDALPDFLTAKYHPTPTLEDVGLASYLDSPQSTPTYLLPALKSEQSLSTAHD